MTDPVFLVPDVQEQLNTVGVGGVFTIPAEEAKHAAVKRIRGGEAVVLSDGRGFGIRALWIGGGQATGQDVLPMRSSHPRVTVVQAIPKSERAELAVDLAVQAGADWIIPWQADRCIAKWDGKPGRAEKARGKWQATAQSAMKQSRRLAGADISTLLTDIADLPAYLGSPPWADTSEVGAQSVRSTTCILALHEEAVTPLSDVNLSVDDIVLVIGPEGGISPRELETIEACGSPGGCADTAQTVVLGPEVYRTVSAAAIALGAIGVLTSRWSR